MFEFPSLSLANIILGELIFGHIDFPRISQRLRFFFESIAFQVVLRYTGLDLINELICFCFCGEQILERALVPVKIV